MPTQVSHQPVGGECRSADGVRGLPPTRPAIPFFLHQLAATAVAPAARAASQRPLVGRWWGCCRRLALHAPNPRRCCDGSFVKESSSVCNFILQLPSDVLRLQRTVVIWCDNLGGPVRSPALLYLAGLRPTPSARFASSRLGRLCAAQAANEEAPCGDLKRSSRELPQECCPHRVRSACGGLGRLISPASPAFEPRPGPYSRRRCPRLSLALRKARLWLPNCPPPPRCCLVDGCRGAPPVSALDLHATRAGASGRSLRGGPRAIPRAHRVSSSGWWVARTPCHGPSLRAPSLSWRLGALTTPPPIWSAILRSV